MENFGLKNQQYLSLPDFGLGMLSDSLDDLEYKLPDFLGELDLECKLPNFLDEIDLEYYRTS
ncbi:hypothetical protein C1645_819642 [Glomus cerebriforme]|uniref:Uncharacterized protein n=1 Tax=Glomus cerebriforme TaxID=658196 RepID=A0A397TE33_9GLOM|nr:hypothetical protein C1645_819642 [Glomus cerebriforme]